MIEVKNRQIHDVSQGASGWHKLRGKYCNASEAPVMLGLSKYMKRDDLLLQKKTGIKPEPTEFDKRRFAEGHRIEALAREYLEESVGDLYTPTYTATVNGIGFLASMDGMTIDCKTIFEHKMRNADLVKSLEKGEIPPMYNAQVQHQLLVTGAEKCIFVASDGTPESMVQIEVLPDENMQKKVVNGWQKFLDDLADYVPPLITVATDEMQTAWDDVRILREQKKAIEAELKDAESRLKKMADESESDQVIGRGFTVKTVKRKGNVDYGKIDALKGIDLDEYRKPSTSYLKITETKIEHE